MKYVWLLLLAACKPDCQDIISEIRIEYGKQGAFLFEIYDPKIGWLLAPMYMLPEGVAKGDSILILTNRELANDTGKWEVGQCTFARQTHYVFRDPMQVYGEGEPDDTSNSESNLFE